MVEIAMAEAEISQGEVGDQRFEEKVMRALHTLLKAGYQIEPEALNLLRTFKLLDPEQLAKDIIEKSPAAGPLSFVTKNLVEAAINNLLHATSPLAEKAPHEDAKPVVADVGKGVYRPYACEVESRIEVLKDPTKEISPRGDLESFLAYFRDRYQKLRRIMRQRLDAKDATTLAEALRQQLGSQVKVLGIVSEKAERGLKVILKLDDPDASATILVKPTKPNLIEKARMILLDQMICVQGVKGPNDLIVAEDLLWPDTPNQRHATATEPVCAVLTSDFHVGSKKFQKALVERFILWLNGRIGTRSERELAGNVKYVIIAGDLVDGIGVYPSQETELEITDIYAQYEVASQLIGRIPEYIEVILIPGNHDAVRKALPQPMIPDRYAGPVYNARKIISLGNPAQVKIHGVNLLIQHGQSLEDLLAALPNVSHENPTRALIQLLKVRHLAPVYGGKTPLAPEPKDLMVVEEVPDIYHTGHLHVISYESYHGTKVLNSGCWQGQTLYQRKMNITPTYGVIPVVNLKSGAISLIDTARIST
ncbi:MAG: DNA-directed DNA polymerase II small subunit [Candidatus Bathyarchaeia archaeon]